MPGNQERNRKKYRRSVGRISRGEAIRAKFLNNIAIGVDDLSRFDVRPPEQLLDALPVDLQIEDPDTEGLGTYIEQGRTIDEVLVYDQNDENYAAVERIVTIELLNGLGDTLKLRINN